MIRIRRSNVPRPPWFGSSEWGKRQSDLTRHLATSADRRSQLRLESVIGGWPSPVAETLFRLFDGRCAVCESVVKKSIPGAIEQFRPPQREGVEGAEDRYAFSYAALLWENLLLMCPECDRARRNLFSTRNPVLKVNPPKFNPRSGVAIRGAYSFLEQRLAEAQRGERSMQIDPSFDEPAEFLVFTTNGKVQPARGESAGEIGEHTIECFRLNRPDLVKRRHTAIASITKLVAKLRLPKFPASAAGAAAVINAAHGKLAPVIDRLGGEFQAAKCHRFARWLRARMNAPLAEVLPLLDWPVATLDNAKRVLLPIWESLGRAEKRPKPKATQKITVNLTGMSAGTSSAHAVAMVVRAPSAQIIRKVELINFRHIRSATFTLPDRQKASAFGPGRELREMIREAFDSAANVKEQDEYCGWKMLLGENGVGKSSVLQAIALALRADADGKESIQEYGDLRRSLSRGCKKGSITVWLTGPEKEIRLEFTKDAVELKSVAADAADSAHGSVPFLRAYGATRLLPRRPVTVGEVAAASPVVPAPDTASGPPRVAPIPDRRAQEVENLFNPYHSLTNAEEWLQKLQPDPRHLAFITLKELLDLQEQDGNLEFQDWHGVPTFGLARGEDFTPLEHFSAGYQSIVALGCDIMAGFGNAIGDMRRRPGIVLLDEIGTNLHPRWRLRIVQALRRAFPELQFVASTHEPLCLRGLGEKEVALLSLQRGGEDGSALASAASEPRKAAKGKAKAVVTAEPPGTGKAAKNDAQNGWRVELTDDLPSPAMFRVDQLLTGEFFRLQSAYDPDEETACNAYYDLLVLERGETPLTARQIELRDFLRQHLRERLVLGDTVAERRVVDALELAEMERRQAPREPVKGSPEAMHAARRLLASVTNTLQPKA